MEKRMEKIKKKRIIRQAGMVYGLFVIALFLVLGFVIGIAVVDGNSMQPTLQNKSLLIYSKFDKNFKKGDIVIIEDAEKELLVKRIVGVEKDVLSIEHGDLYINGKQESAEYRMGETRVKQGNVTYPYEIKKDQIFVMGDNRENSKDSRMFGACSASQIKGKVIFHIGVENDKETKGN
ncbi:MAG: signal peptidase I [Lachnospiraceae bacterium]|nr:signal peptidase I [Lachnospiraceae bacterium]